LYSPLSGWSAMKRKGSSSKPTPAILRTDEEVIARRRVQRQNNIVATFLHASSWAALGLSLTQFLTTEPTRWDSDTSFVEWIEDFGCTLSFGCGLLLRGAARWPEKHLLLRLLSTSCLAAAFAAPYAPSLPIALVLAGVSAGASYCGTIFHPWENKQMDGSLVPAQMLLATSGATLCGMGATAFMAMSAGKRPMDGLQVTVAAVIMGVPLALSPACADFVTLSVRLTTTSMLGLLMAIKSAATGPDGPGPRLTLVIGVLLCVANLVPFFSNPFNENIKKPMRQLRAILATRAVAGYAADGQEDVQAIIGRNFGGGDCDRADVEPSDRGGGEGGGGDD